MPAFSRIASGLLALSWLPSTALAEPAKPCEFSVAPGMHCRSNSFGQVISGSSARAEQLLQLGEEGAQRFELRFRRKAARFAIVEIGSNGLTDDLRNRLKGAGIPIILPWLSPDGFREQLRASVRRSLGPRIASLPPEAQAAALASADAQIDRQLNEKAAYERDATAIPHELGHLWLNHGFWPQQDNAGAGHYGGPGPDWLDELAAVILEPDFSAETRRSQFEKRYRASIAGEQRKDDPLLDLGQFFAEAHPANDQAKALIEKPQSGQPAPMGSVTVLTGDEAAKFSGDSLTFYLKSRMVADFLIEKTRDPGIFGEIAGAMAKDGDFGHWLAARGRHYGLPGDIKGFNEAWLTWLRLRYP